MKLEFNLDDPKALAEQLDGLLQERAGAIRRVPVSALRQGVFELLALIQARVPKKTATLVRSITAVVVKISEDISEGRVGTPLKYAKFLEDGTGLYGPGKQPITIVAKNRKALFWGAYDGKGGPLFRTRAIVKGIKPRHDFANAIAEFLPRYQQIVEQHLAGVIG
ncbi:MAG TPA: HK97 gp10 family phage protein [Bryobacteraceae bacterium]|nr:HK97 gp10 family phage protein [Bryobacteraceae bacterium]